MYEFFILTDGLAPSSTAAREEFDDVPEGKTTDDVYIFGLFDARSNLLGAIAGVRYYPDCQTWWIGLMMLAPEQRGRGLGADFYRAFEHWVSAQGISQISLVAIEANESGLQFWKRMGFEVIRKTPPRQYKAKTHKVYVLSRTIAGGWVKPRTEPLGSCSFTPAIFEIEGLFQNVDCRGDRVILPASKPLRLLTSGCSQRSIHLSLGLFCLPRLSSKTLDLNPSVGRQSEVCR